MKGISKTQAKKVHGAFCAVRDEMELKYRAHTFGAIRREPKAFDRDIRAALKANLPDVKLKPTEGTAKLRTYNFMYATSKYQLKVEPTAAKAIAIDLAYCGELEPTSHKTTKETEKMNNKSDANENKSKLNKPKAADGAEKPKDKAKPKSKPLLKPKPKAQAEAENKSKDEHKPTSQQEKDAARKLRNEQKAKRIAISAKLGKTLAANVKRTSSAATFTYARAMKIMQHQFKHLLGTDTPDAILNGFVEILEAAGFEVIERSERQRFVAILPDSVPAYNEEGAKTTVLS